MTYVLEYSEWKKLYEQSMGGMVSSQTFAQASTDSAKALVKKAMSYSLSEVMEGLREFLSSGTGLIAQVLIDIFGGPFGAFINVGAWSALLVYDISVGVKNNDWNWFNIIISAVGVATTGLGSKAVKSALAPIKSVGKKGLDYFVKQMAKVAPKTFKYIKGLFLGIGKLVKIASINIGKLIKWVSSKLKGSSLYKGLTNLQTILTDSVPRILTSIESSFGKEAALAVEQTAAKSGHVASHTGQHYVEHDVTHKTASAITGGHGSHHKGKSGKLTAATSNKRNKPTA